ncbi:hypothetical protein AM1_C0089 (plasmid) [Acaryochloris marina MBIC11017]|uniref:Uncharacterized protein n=1 Tax=Acaryochloris marina (strain MBIC 11017) TaxID=329726 RepID=A8ZMI6_ACAM1|nr:hypothetical protein AM1_C0089 [Acaryochloris marina MBIC11017]
MFYIVDLTSIRWQGSSIPKNSPKVELLQVDTILARFSELAWGVWHLQLPQHN